MEILGSEFGGGGKKLWKLGNELGVGFMGSDEEMVERLIELEKRHHINWTEMERVGDARGDHEDS